MFSFSFKSQIHIIYIYVDEHTHTHIPYFLQTVIIKASRTNNNCEKRWFTIHGDFYQKFSRTVLLKFYVLPCTCMSMYGTKANTIHAIYMEEEAYSSIRKTDAVILQYGIMIIIIIHFVYYINIWKKVILNWVHIETKTSKIWQKYHNKKRTEKKTFWVELSNL